MSEKIAYIRVWPSPAIGRSVARMLEGAFPEYQIETINITDLLRKRGGLTWRNLFHTFKEHGLASLKGRDGLRRHFFRTTYLFQQVKELVAEQLESEDYAFSFQLQSLFDASAEHLPHFIYTDHTHLANLSYPGYDDERLMPPKWIALERGMYHNATGVFTRSMNIRQSLLQDYGCPPEKVQCVYSGGNLRPTDESQRDYQAKRILFVGADWERKGGPELVEAFRIVRQAHPDAKLVIVGSQPRINLPGCEVLGPLPLSAIQPHYEEASIFCLPTHREPFGLAFIEAMAFKLPVVATRIGAIPEFVVEGESGYLVEPGDAEGLAGALARLLEAPDLCRRFGERGYRLTQERYNWENVGKLVRKAVLEALKLTPAK